jgi:uncharacterized protein YajQ (UPF0234 family)
MPSFDIVSKIDLHEVTNAVDQSNREVDNRFDFKGTGAKFELTNNTVILTAQNTFQLQQMVNILELKFAKRKIDIKCLKKDEPQENLHEAKQIIQIPAFAGMTRTINQEITIVIPAKAGIQNLKNAYPLLTLN